jgi:RES domain-containing protein
MFAYRVDKNRYVASVLQGIPGEVSDFRWNTKGNPIIYASSTRSLALNEKTGNLSKPWYGLSLSYVMVIIQLPDFVYRKIMPEDLPNGWDNISVYHPRTQEIGDEFSNSDELALYVPSSMVPGEFNVLINPGMAERHNISVSVEEINDRLKDLR